MVNTISFPLYLSPDAIPMILSFSIRHLNHSPTSPEVRNIVPSFLKSTDVFNCGGKARNTPSIGLFPTKGSKYTDRRPPIIIPTPKPKKNFFIFTLSSYAIVHRETDLSAILTLSRSLPESIRNPIPGAIVTRVRNQFVKLKGLRISCTPEKPCFIQTPANPIRMTITARINQI